MVGEVVDLHDVRMVDLDEESAFGDGRRHRVGIAGIDQPLEDDPPVAAVVGDVAVAAEVDPAEAAVRQRAENLVAPVDQVTGLELGLEGEPGAVPGQKPSTRPGWPSRPRPTGWLQLPQNRRFSGTWGSGSRPSPGRSRKRAAPRRGRRRRRPRDERPLDDREPRVPAWLPVPTEPDQAPVPALPVPALPEPVPPEPALPEPPLPALPGGATTGLAPAKRMFAAPGPGAQPGGGLGRPGGRRARRQAADGAVPVLDRPEAPGGLGACHSGHCRPFVARIARW